GLVGDIRPHPEERACRRRSANSKARTRVSKDEDGRLGSPHASRRIAAHLSYGSTCACRAAMLLSMRPRCAAHFGQTRPRGRTTVAAGNDRRLRSIVSGLLFTMDGATSTCRAVGARSADLPPPGAPPVFSLLFTGKQRSACTAATPATRTFRARGAVTAC